MTVRLSRLKVTKIMRLYFIGLTQVGIATKAAVDQSTVSLYATRFKEIVDIGGLLAAGKEFEVEHEVDDLRSLAVELANTKLTTEDAKYGTKIMKTFMRLGIDPNQHIGLIEICKNVDDPGFINAALKLNRIEAMGQMTYEEATSTFERVFSELTPAENRLSGIQAKLKSLNKLIAQRNSELTNIEAHVVQLQKETKAKEAKLEHELDIKMKRLNVQYKEVEAVTKLKTDLSKQRLDLPTLLKLATEFK